MNLDLAQFSRTQQQVLLLSAAVALIVTAGAIYYAAQGEEVYNSLQLEDGIIEYLTVVFFFSAGGLLLHAMLAKDSKLKEVFKDSRFLLIILAILCIYAALEEISFGQRIIGWDSPEYFEENSTQKETDTHNIEGLEFIFAIAAGVLLLYGVILPFGLRYLPERFDWFRVFFGMRIPYPSTASALLFLAGSLFIVIDVVSKALGNQVVGNEYQEFFFGYGFLVFALYLADEDYQKIMKVL